MKKIITHYRGNIPIFLFLFFLSSFLSNVLQAQVSIHSSNTASGTSWTDNSLTSVPAGALLVLVTSGELHSTNNCTVSSTPSLTWTKRADAQATNSGDAEIWTALFTAGGSITVRSDWSGATHQAAICYAITGQETTLGGASATGNSQSAPSVNITTTRAASIIIGGVCDWNAVDGSSRTYRDAATETFYHRAAGWFTTYNFYKSAATVTTYTEGLTAPTGQSGGTVLYEVRRNPVLDTIPPSSFTLSSPGHGCTTIDLSWTTPTDNVGVTGYEIFVGGISVGTTTNTTYTVTGRTASTTYNNIYVRATDAATNGTNSNTISVTTDSCAAPCVSILSTSTQTGSSATVHSLNSVPAGALLVLTTTNETDYDDTCSVHSSPALTWIKRADAEANNSGNAEIWTAVFTAGGNINVTSDWGSSSQASVCYVVQNYEPGLAGNAAFVSSQSAPSLSRNTGRDNSIIFCATSDWNAISGASRTYRNSPTEKLYGTVGGGFTYYHYIKETTTAGNYEMGLSAPTGQSAGTVSYEIRCIPGAGERQNLIFDQNFEGSHTWDNFVTTQDAGHAWSRQQSTIHKNEGANSFRAEVRSGCDGYVSSGYRSEIEPRNVPDEGIMWYGFSIYFDEPFNSGNWTGSEAGHYIQWHPAASGGSATLALWGSTGKWNLVTNPDSTTSASAHTINTDITRGWHHFVFKVNWSSAGGYVKVWIDGTVLFDLTHNTSSSWNASETLNWKTSGRYLKLGMNRWGSCSTPSCPSGSVGPCDTWILYYDNLRIGNSSATYDDVAPVTGGGSRIAMPRIPDLPLQVMPVKYILGQNYPNPFTKQTTIQFTLPQAEKINLSLFDVNGHVVKVLMNGSKEAGTHTVSFDAGTLSKGVYYYKMQAGDFTDVKKLTIQ